LGLQSLVDRISEKNAEESGLKIHLEGLFPRDSVQNARFSINFFTSIGLGALTEDLRDFLKDAPKLLLEKKY
jgi:pre-mRNA-splicing factor CWC22